MSETVSQQVSGVIPWRKRADLILRLDEAGSWIVKDPLCLQYVLLNEQELCVLRMLDGCCSMQRIKDRLNLAWPKLAIEVTDIVDLLNQLIARRLVVPLQTLVHAGSGNTASAASSRRTQSPGSILAAATQIFRIQIHLFDPKPLLRRLHPLIQLAFSRRAAVIAAFIVATAGMLVLLRFQQLTNQLAVWDDFFGSENLVLLLISFVGIKAMHELGHACAAHRFGVECRDAGVMLLFFAPLLYTNVTDSWMADRRSRLIITAAGVLTELVIASLCAILWFFTNPGVTQNLLLNIMILCTVSTLLFNGNPLLRYDGYFLLVDVVRRPNLAAHASVQIRTTLETLLWGRESGRVKSHDRFLLTYGVLSFTYRCMLTIGILAMLIRLAADWNIGIAGLILTTMAAITLIVIPVSGLVKDLLVGLMSRQDRGPRAIRGAAIMILLAAVMAVPLPCSILVPAVVEPSGHPVYATLGGQLTQHLDYGDQVLTGDIVAVLDDRQTMHELLKLRGEVELQQLRIRAFELQRIREDASQLPVAKEILLAATTRMTQFEEQMDRLRIRSPAAGVLMPPRETTFQENETTLAFWTGQPLHRSNQLAMVEAGTILGYVTDPQQLDVIAFLTENELHRILRDQTVRLHSTEYTWRTYPGTIQRISTVAVAAGEVPAELIAAGMLKPPNVHSDEPEGKFWQVQIRVQCRSTDCPALYSVGTVRIPVASLSVLRRVKRYLRSAFLDQPTI